MIMETPYSLAWADFKASKEFKHLMDLATRDTTIPHRYIENRIREAFDAGWNRRASHEFYGEYTPGSRRQP